MQEWNIFVDWPITTKGKYMFTNLDPNLNLKLWLRCYWTCFVMIEVWNISCYWFCPFHPQTILIDKLTPCGSGYPSHVPIGSPWMHKPNLLFSCHLLNNTQGPITSRRIPYGHHTYGKNCLGGKNGVLIPFPFIFLLLFFHVWFLLSLHVFWWNTTPIAM
jgi:hypothetical protein